MLVGLAAVRSNFCYTNNYNNKPFNSDSSTGMEEGMINCKHLNLLSPEEPVDKKERTIQTCYRSFG